MSTGIKNIKGHKGLKQRQGRILYAFTYMEVKVVEPAGLEVNNENLNIAMDRLNVINAEIFKGTFDYATYFPNSAKLAKFGGKKKGSTFNEIYDRWWTIWEADNPAAKPNTIRDYQNCIRNHILPALGGRIIASFTVEDLIKWNQNLRSTRPPYNLLSSQKVINCHTIVKRVFAHAMATGEFERQNPWDAFDAYKVSTRGQHKKSRGSKRTHDLEPYTSKERQAIINGWPEHMENERNLTAFNMAMGLRIGEAIALTWDKIDLKAETVTVNMQRQAQGWERCKAGSDRLLDLSKPAVEALKRQKQLMMKSKATHVEVRENVVDKNGEVVFTKEGRLRFVFPNSATNGPYKQTSQFSNRWSRLLFSLGIPTVQANGTSQRGPNYMRHTFASRALTAGASYIEVARELGNTESATRDHYACLIEEDRISTKELKNSWLEATE